MKQLIAVILLVLLSFTGFAQRPYYGGGHHTKSHGGYYAGGHGSSHRGGHYVNRYSNNHYGRHK